MLSDWDIYKSDAAVQVGIDPLSPLVGPGSLVLGKGTFTTGRATANLVSKGVTYTPVGLLRGALAGVISVPTFTNDNASGQDSGVLCLQSARDLTGTSGTAYGLWAEARLTGVIAINLVRLTGGLDASETVLWTETLTPPLALGTVFTLELEWEVSAEYAGIRFIVRRGQATNYSDLVTKQDMILPVDPLPTESLGEGPCLHQTAGSTIDHKILADQWRLRA